LALLKKIILVPIIILVLFAAIYIVFYRGPPKVEFSEDGLIVSDTGEPYEDGVQGVFARTAVRGAGFSFALSLIESPRSAFVKFQEAYWRDGHLTSIPSRLRSKNYRIILTIGFSNVEIDMMDVGEVLEIPSAVVTIGFIDADTGELAGYALRTTPTLPEPGLSGFSFGNYTFFVNVTAPEQHQALYDEGHVTLMRVSRDTWTVDVDTWLAIFQPNTEEEPVEYYVRLSFRMTVTMKTLV